MGLLGFVYHQTHWVYGKIYPVKKKFWVKRNRVLTINVGFVMAGNDLMEVRPLLFQVIRG